MLQRVMTSEGMSQAPLGLKQDTQHAIRPSVAAEQRSAAGSTTRMHARVATGGPHVLDQGLIPTRKAEVLKPKATTARTDAGMCGSVRSGSMKKLGIGLLKYW